MILSIDIGIKNLALCIMSKTDNDYIIHLWDIYSILPNEIITIPKCDYILKNNKTCSRNAKYNTNTKKFCKIHYIKNNLIITTKSLIKVNKSKNINTFLLQDLAQFTIKKIEEIFNNHIDIFFLLQKIQIELQPKINNKMKFISHIVYGKLIDLFLFKSVSIPSIRFMPASKKSIAFNSLYIDCTIKNKYKRRKFMSIEYCKKILSSDKNNQNWLEFFEKCSKKDDLSDVFCMNMVSL